MTAFDKAWSVAKGEDDERFRGLPESPDYGFSPENAWKEGVISPEEALQICEAGGCVWLKDWSTENYGSEEDPHYDYPTEDPDDIRMWMEEGMFDGPNAPIILTDPAGSFGEMIPEAVEKPFKLRSREDFPCDHNMELTDESESPTGTLYHTYTCSKCGESSTSSPS